MEPQENKLSSMWERHAVLVALHRSRMGAVTHGREAKHQVQVLSRTVEKERVPASNCDNHRTQ
jgi:hypothetical protein